MSGHRRAPALEALSLDAFDRREGYCRQLGHHVGFTYCRRERSGDARRPCGRIADCWFQRIPIEDWLRANFSTVELAAIFAPPPQKVETILDIVARVRGARGEGGS